MKNFLELTVTTTHDGSELVSDIFWNYSKLGVVILDAQDALDLLKSGKNWDYADNDVFSENKTVFVKAYFPEEDAESPTLAERDIAALKSRAVITVPWGTGGGVSGVMITPAALPCLPAASSLPALVPLLTAPVVSVVLDVIVTPLL